MHRNPIGSTNVARYAEIPAEFRHWCPDRNTVESNIARAMVANCFVERQPYYFAIAPLAVPSLVPFVLVPLVFAAKWNKAEMKNQDSSLDLTTFWCTNLKFFSWNLWCGRTICRRYILTILIVCWWKCLWIVLWLSDRYGCTAHIIVIILFEWIVFF